MHVPCCRQGNITSLQDMTYTCISAAANANYLRIMTISIAETVDSDQTQTCTIYRPPGKVSFFLSHMVYRAALISVSLALSQTPVYTMRDHGYGASTSRGVSAYAPAFAGTHCAYPRRDGQAALNSVTGYVNLKCLRLPARRRNVTHPSTNRALRGATTLIETDALLHSRTATGQRSAISRHLLTKRNS